MAKIIIATVEGQKEIVPMETVDLNDVIGDLTLGIEDEDDSTDIIEL